MMNELQTNELQTIEGEVIGQRALFNYAALDAETRIVVQQRAGEIKSIAKRMAADVVEIGEKLADVKQRLGANDRFNDWLSAELGWSPRTAHNFIGVWRRFGSANFAIENVAVSALYALAAPSTPAEAIEEVRQIADSGQEVTHTLAKEIIDKAKAARPKQAELVEAVDPSAICLCGCKAGDHVRNGRYLECTNCECEIFQEASAEEIAERNAAETALGITPSKSPVPPPGAPPTAETIARLKAEMGLEEEGAEKAYADLGVCRVCGCTDADCRGCIEKTGAPCYWVSNDLCSACAPPDAALVPVVVEVEQADLDAMDRLNAVDDILDGEPAPYYEIDYGPLIVIAFSHRGAAGQVIEARGYRIIPEDKAGDFPKPSRKPGLVTSLIGYRVNIHTKREPNWYVIVGPQYEFRLALSAAAEELESPERDTVPAAPARPAPVSVEKRPVSKTPSNKFSTYPEGWFDTEIEIRIRLLPGGDAATRKLRYEVRVDEANDGEPFIAEHYGEDMLYFSLPAEAYKLIQQAAAAFVPGSAPTKDPKQMRREALARYRGVPVESVVLEDEGDDPKEIRLPYQEVSQADIDILAEYYAADKIAEGDRVKLCHFDGKLYVVTMVSSGPAGHDEVWAYPALPLASFVGDVRTYKDAEADYYAGDISNPDHVFSYERIKINCGSKKNPLWYVITGPNTVFKVDYAAAYRDGEPKFEDEDEGFRPGFPPGFDVKKAEQGLAQAEKSEEDNCWAEWLASLSGEEREKYENAPCRCGHAREFHEEDDRTGEYNAECTALNCGKTSPVERCTGYHCRDCDTKGGHQASCKHYILGEGRPVQPEELKGTVLAEEEKSALRSSQLNEHGVYVKGVKNIKVPMPKKAGKVEVIINLVQDREDKMWRSSHSVSAGNGSCSSLPGKRSEAFESRELALQEACANARVFLLRHGSRGDTTNAQKRQIEAAIPALDDWGAINTGAINTADYSADYPDNEIEALPEDLDDDDIPYAEAPTEFSQGEINRMADYSASAAIPNQQPVEICRILDKPFVITGAVWKGEDCLQVNAMPILPLESAGVKNAKTYSQAVAARRNAGISEVLSYEGIKINCGSKKKPDWWVMVGPEIAVVSGANLEADPEEVDLPQPNEPTIEDALHHALHHVQNAAERWKPLQYAGADDHELMRAIAFEFVGQGGSSQNGGWSVRGGKSPQFTWKRDGSTLKGKRLLAKVREVLEIGPPIPAETAPADADDFTAPRCSECGRIDGAHTPECSQSPNNLTFKDYLAYAEFTKPKAPSSWARKWTLSREMDGTVLAWRLHWKELEDSGVTPFLQLCKCGHPLPKHKPEVRCEGKIGDQGCQCVKFVDSAKAEEPKSTKKGRESQ